MAHLKIALTLPGEGSLGAFEAGAVAALLVAVQAVNEQDAEALTVDAVTAASSGALTAVLAAGALLTGEDPVTPLRRAWVSEPSLAALWGRSSAAPLSLDRAREVGHALLRRMLLPESKTNSRDDRAQESAVTLEFALTCLRGFSYEFPRLHSPTPGPRDRVAATSYMDWSQHRLAPSDADGFTAEWLAALNAAIASASDPLVFPPTLLHRPRQAFEEYKKNGVRNLPLEVESVDDPAARDELWYADGALVDREPVGRCLRLTSRLDEKEQEQTRIVVVVRPRADYVPGRRDGAWTGAGEAPRWRTTLARAYRIMTTHNLYEDLRRVEKTNDRIAWANQLIEDLTPVIDADPRARERLEGLGARIQRDRKKWRRHHQQSVSDLLEFVVRSAAGLEHKRQIDVEVVAAPDTARLAGAARGFLAERLRANDFLVGYRQMVDWMEHTLPAYDADHLQTGVNAARNRAANIPGWTGGTSISRRTAVRGSATLLRAGLRAGRVGLREVRVPRKASR